MDSRTQAETKIRQRLNRNELDTTRIMIIAKVIREILDNGTEGDLREMNELFKASLQCSFRVLAAKYG